MFQRYRHSLKRLLATGWGRLAIVMWAMWAIGVWFFVDDEYRWWTEEALGVFALLGFGCPLGAIVAGWWIAAGFRNQTHSKKINEDALPEGCKANSEVVPVSTESVPVDATENAGTLSDAARPHETAPKKSTRRIYVAGGALALMLSIGVAGGLGGKAAKWALNNDSRLQLESHGWSESEISHLQSALRATNQKNKNSQLRGMPPFLSKRMADCVVAKTQAKWPLGKRQMMTEQPNLFQAMHVLGEECGREITTAIAQRGAWDDEFNAYANWRCLQIIDGATEEWCACFVDNARNIYRTPMQFLTETDSAYDAMDKAERQRLHKLTRRCAKHK